MYFLYLFNMAFLRKQGASGNYTFDVIYSAFQKLMRRNDVDTCIELAKEFKEYPNALKGRLLYNVAEDICDLNLLISIYDTDADINELIKFIPVCCNHVKCREGLYAFRIACEKELNFEEFNEKDDLLTAMTKLRTKIKTNKVDEVIDYYELYYNCDCLKKIFKYMKENRTFLYSLVVYDKLEYTHEKFTIPNDIKFDINNIKQIKFPKFVFDKHTAIGKRNPETSDYSFFIDNLILSPRHTEEETEIEIEGKRLYKESNKSTGEFLAPIEFKKKKDILNKHKYLQTQLITGRNKPKTYYYDYDDDGKYKFILKGQVSDTDYLRNKLSDSLKADLGLLSQNIRFVGNYMLSDNFINIDPSDYVVKTSKLEKDVKIFNGETYGATKELIDKLNDEECLEWFKCLAFRKIVGTNDTCFRNFLYINHHMITIDDPMLNDYSTEYMFKTKLNETYGKKFENKLNICFDDVVSWLNESIDVIKSATYLSKYNKVRMIKQAKKLLNIDNWKF